jgi:hypothetical protein
VAPSSSSTKKAARLAKSGQGKKVRFQGGTLFPLVVAIVVVLGVSLVVYSRQSRPAADASAPTVNDHWHHAYGFYLCDTWIQLEGDLEEQTSTGFSNTDFARTGIHSHNDGLMHWHPFTSASVGTRATLGLFLDNYGVELTNDKLTFPESQFAALQAEGLLDDENPGVFEEGETTCTIDGVEEDAELKVVVWNNYTDTDDGTTYIADFDNIRLNQDQMVVAIAFVPDSTDVGMPTWAPDLPSLGAIDTGQLTPTDLRGETTVPTGSVAVDSSDAETPTSTDG